MLTVSQYSPKPSICFAIQILCHKQLKAYTCFAIPKPSHALSFYICSLYQLPYSFAIQISCHKAAQSLHMLCYFQGLHMPCHNFIQAKAMLCHSKAFTCLVITNAIQSKHLSSTSQQVHCINCHTDQTSEFHISAGLLPQNIAPNYLIKISKLYISQQPTHLNYLHIAH